MSPGLNTDRGAVLSDDGRYRFRLWRRFAPGHAVVWVMLNPSTADADSDDPTIRRCIGFTRAWGFGRADVVNLFPWRATDPADLDAARKRYDVMAWDENARHITRAIGEAGTAPVVAWGAHPVADLAVQRFLGLCQTVYAAGAVLAPRLVCLGTTKDGSPRHPLYVRGDARPVEWWPL